MPDEKVDIPMDTLIYDAKFKRDRYICDPRKNTMCNHRGCFWSGGLPSFNPCFCTSYFNYAVGTYEEMDSLLKEYHKKVTEIAKEAAKAYGIKNEGHEKQSDDE